ncbi:hypothetical protein OC926_22820 [Pseudomonas peradeniyensis]|jgi:hypothetical protein|uniref:hypothetical protein n=1 Tax=Pseudomonas TaxID=286 RepID=UPI000CDC72DB|nr:MULTISPECIES: hypothetical protein [Pseudomonas]AUY32654.1 hypothetical protein C3F42_05185 [Pseudomonas sp. PONIH3]MCU7282687.1 hypothetical protein [Pseudomonas peradeniyensis]
MSKGLHINPIAGWQFKAVEHLQLVLMEISYLSTPFQNLDEAQKAPLLGLTAQEARELSEALRRSAEHLEGLQMRSPEGPKH